MAKLTYQTNAGKIVSLDIEEKIFTEVDIKGNEVTKKGWDVVYDILREEVRNTQEKV